VITGRSVCYFLLAGPLEGWLWKTDQVVHKAAGTKTHIPQEGKFYAA
jgi:hypothetical protein